MTSNSSNEEALKRIQEEHHELRELLGKIHQALTQHRQDIAEVSSLLNTLKDQIEEHFREEEEGGFFEQITDQAPRLQHRAGEVRDQHADLSERISQLCVQASTGSGDESWWQEMERQFHDFSKELMHHEGRENELLQDAYAQDIGPTD
jgi:iron-sulfur cluster repair protein YtfE (RIC family)